MPVTILSASQVYVVIPVFNSWAEAQRCLDALRASTAQGFTVVVVDHGPTDTVRRALSAQYPEVTRLAGSPELWWTGATNLGIRYALARGAGAVVLLNHDCYLAPDAIEHMLHHATSLPDAVIAPIQREYPSGRIFCAGARACFLLGFPSVHTRRSLQEPLAAPVLRPVSLICGGRGALIPSQVFRKVGLLDEEQLPHYGADHDFYLRCRKAGVPLFVATDAVVHVDHVHTTTADHPGRLDFGKFLRTLTSRRSHRNIRDLATLFRKHYPIRWLYPVGVVLNLARYCTIYIFQRAARWLLPGAGN